MWGAFYISLLCFTLVPCFSSPQFNGTNLTETLLSCSYQLWTNETEYECLIKRLGFNNPECQNELTETPLTRSISQKAIIKIEPYKDLDGSRTALNISAYNITWNNLKIRFQQQNTENCMKRLITIKKKVPSDKILFYDIPWATAQIEDTYIDFEYTSGVNNFDGKSTFLIHVPKLEDLKYFNASNLKYLSLFTYVETTNLYQLICKIHAAPQHLNVASYEIYVYLRKNHNFTRIDGPFVKNAESAVFGVIDFEYDTYGIPGEYIFHVKPWDCPTCRDSMSPVVIIPESSTILTIGIVGVSCLIPIFLIILYMYFKVDSGSIPRVLLITTPANNAHKTIGKSLANLLIEKYNIPTMIDILDIPIPNIMPSDWFAKSFKNATHIIILMSDDKPVTSIYRNIDNLLYTLMQGDPDKICCTLEFPFTKKVDFKFHVHRNFKLMQEYRTFINFIHNRGLLRSLMKRVMRNDLYYDLVRQIDHYGNDVNCSGDCDETVSQSGGDSEDECKNQNEKNRVEEQQEGMSLDVPEIVRICLDKVNSSKTSMKSDDSDDSDVESSADIQSLLRNSLGSDDEIPDT